MNDDKKVFLNIPQLKCQVVKARTTVAICGRATGKTEGMISPFLWQNIQAMPRSFGCLGTNTYSDILSKILDKVISGWERMGVYRGDHFVIGKFNDKWKRPFGNSVEAKYSIHTAFGSGVGFAAVNTPRLSAGRDYDYLTVDECKHIDYEKLKEVFPTVRGNYEHFGHLHNHLSRLYVTDMPTSEKGRWILNYQHDMDEVLINYIINYQYIVNETELKLENKEIEENYGKAKIDRINKILNELRKKATLFITASTLDNVHVLGLDVIDQLYKSLNYFDFRTSVLNEFMLESQHKYYKDFKDKHTHTADDLSYLDTLDLMEVNVKDSRWDSDCNPDVELHLGADYNRVTNHAIVGQYDGQIFKILNHLDSSQDLNVKDKKQEKQNVNLRDCAMKFCNYYKFHTRKFVHFHFDNTAKVGNASQPDYAFHKEWTGIMRENGWVVEEHDLGRASIHANRMLFFEKLFTGQLSYKTSINATNCEDLIAAIKGTGTKKNSKGFDTKDKSSERLGSSVPYRRQTHPTEAFDLVQQGFAKYMTFKGFGEDSLLRLLNGG